VSTQDERKIVDCVMGTTLESGKSSGESSREFGQSNNGSITGSTHDPLTSCGSRFLLRDWVNYRRTADEAAMTATQRKGRRKYIPLVRLLTEVLRDYWRGENDEVFYENACYYRSIYIPLKVLIYTPTAKLPGALKDDMRQAFPGVSDDAAKVLDEETLDDFKANPKRAWGLIRALKSWVTVHFEDD
jgi:hypothetical protein